MNRSDDICFRAEATLGKLAKWLRLLGFDTVYDGQGTGVQELHADDKDRILLTRTKRIHDRNTGCKCVFVACNDPFEQVREVLHTLDIAADDIRPFSRCIPCNCPTNPVDRDTARDYVPDYVWETHVSFWMCSLCRRFYWAGSHPRRAQNMINQIFEPCRKETHEQQQQGDRPRGASKKM
jgi:uncharacterized protein with PIN domain